MQDTDICCPLSLFSSRFPLPFGTVMEADLMHHHSKMITLTWFQDKESKKRIKLNESVYFIPVISIVFQWFFKRCFSWLFLITITIHERTRKYLFR